MMVITREAIQHLKTRVDQSLIKSALTEIDGGDVSENTKGFIKAVCEMTFFKGIVWVDPRPKRAFEDGAFYPVTIQISGTNAALWYSKDDNVFYYADRKYPIEDLSFIGAKLQNSLWEE